MTWATGARRLRRAPAVALLLLVILVAGLPRLVGISTVVSSSMAPGLVAGDRVVVNELVGALLPVRRGDVVVLADPGGWRRAAAALDGRDPPTRDGLLVKRVIGLAGDRVRCCAAGGRLLVDGRPLAEPYAAVRRPQPAFDVVVPPGHLWLVGDNRDASFDSRALVDTRSRGFVCASRVIGRVEAAF